MSRQWQGRREQANEDEEGEEDTSFSGSGSAGRTSRSGNGKKGSIGPPPAYDGSREAGVQDSGQAKGGEPCMGDTTDAIALRTGF